MLTKQSITNASWDRKVIIGWTLGILGAGLCVLLMLQYEVPKYVVQNIHFNAQNPFAWLGVVLCTGFLIAMCYLFSKDYKIMSIIFLLATFVVAFVYFVMPDEKNNEQQPEKKSEIVETPPSTNTSDSNSAQTVAAEEEEVEERNVEDDPDVKYFRDSLRKQQRIRDSVTASAKKIKAEIALAEKKDATLTALANGPLCEVSTDISNQEKANADDQKKLADLRRKKYSCRNTPSVKGRETTLVGNEGVFIENVKNAPPSRPTSKKG